MTRLVSLIPEDLRIDLFSLYILFSHFRPRDATRGNSFFQMSSYARANLRITNEKTKGKFPWGHHVVWNGKTKCTSWKGLFSDLACFSKWHWKAHGKITVHAATSWCYLLKMNLKRYNSESHHSRRKVSTPLSGGPALMKTLDRSIETLGLESWFQALRRIHLKSA